MENSLRIPREDHDVVNLVVVDLVEHSFSVGPVTIPGIDVIGGVDVRDCRRGLISEAPGRLRNHLQTICCPTSFHCAPLCFEVFIWSYNHDSCLPPMIDRASSLSIASTSRAEVIINQGSTLSSLTVVIHIGEISVVLSSV